jgi:ankyrin repeat protein
MAVLSELGYCALMPGLNHELDGRLVDAVHNGRLSEIAELIAAGADPNAIDPDDDQPLLFVAVEAGGAPLVRALLAAGADPNRRDGFGWSPLRFVCGDASSPGAADMVDALLAHGANARDTDGKETALTRALSADLTDRKITPEMERIVRALVSAGAEHCPSSITSRLTARSWRADDTCMTRTAARLMSRAPIE